MMKRCSERLLLCAIALLTLVGTSLCAQGQTKDQAPRPARTRSDEMLDSRRRWSASDSTAGRPEVRPTEAMELCADAQRR
jgi:hypothetical protein